MNDTVKRSLNALILVAIFVVIALGLAACSCARETEEVTEEQPTSTFEVVDKGVESEPERKEVVLRDEPYYFLVIGNDARDGTAESSNPVDKGTFGYADTIMLVRIDPKSYLMSILTIPRDTPVEYEGKKGKINNVYHNAGPEGLCGAVEVLTGIKPEYYITMNFAQFISFIDDFGGIDVNAPIYVEFEDVNSKEMLGIDPGEQHLNGAEALVFARVRKMYVYGDACRQYNSRHMVETAIQNVAADADTADAKIQVLLDHAITNWSEDELQAQIMDFVAHGDQIHFYEGTGPYEGEVLEDYGGWVCYKDDDLWKRLSETFAAGEDPTTVFPLAPLDAA